MTFVKGGAAPKTAAKKKEKQSESSDASDFKIESSESYEFRLVDSVPRSFTVPRKIKVWDETEDRLRVIRYASTEESPYLDEQNEEIGSESDIEFVRGKLIVPGTKKSLIKYLLAHDWLKGKKVINPDNERGRDSFYLVDKDAGVLSGLALKKAISKATSIVEGADPEKLKAFMLSVFAFDADALGGVSKKEEAILLEAYKSAAASPELFIKEFNNEKHLYKAIFTEALKAGLISDAKDGLVSRTDTDAVVLSFDEDKYTYAADALADFAQEETAGKVLFNELKDTLEGK